MADSYSAPNFSIDTGPSNVAYLTTLKGSAPAATDNVYVSEAATHNWEQNCSINQWYIGDNPAGTAVVKTGYITCDAGVTVTFGTNTTHQGMNGEGSTSTVTFNGTSASGCTITCTNADKVTNLNCNQCQITATYTTFEHLNTIYLGNSLNSFSDCNFTDCLYGVIVTGGGTYNLLPAVFSNNTATGCAYFWRDAGTTSFIEYGDFFVRFPLKCVGNADGSSGILINVPSATRYFAAVWSANPVTFHKTLGGAGLKGWSL